MKTHIVRIGHSRGIRILKHLLDQAGLRDVVESSVEDDGYSCPALIGPLRQ